MRHIQQRSHGDFNSGDRIAYTYLHSLNSVSKVHITKKGTFLYKITHKKPNVIQRVAVMIDGNRSVSSLDPNKLKKI